MVNTLKFTQWINDIKGLNKSNVCFDLKLFNVYEFYKKERELRILHSFLTNSEEIITVGCYSDMLLYVLLALKKVKEDFILGGLP